MSLLLRGLFANICDVVIAFWHLMTRQTRGRYSGTIDIRAPRALVWDLLLRREIAYARADVTVRLTPIPGLDDAFTSTMTVRGRELPGPAFQHLRKEPERRLVSLYLREHTQVQDHIGEDDRLMADLEDIAGGSTRLRFTRELTHLRAGTRISAPIGVRQGLYFIQVQAEHEAGHEQPRATLVSQLGWSLVAFLSFAWIAGWTDAAILMLVIAVHEAGHAAAMLYYGLGVSFVGFIPFLGGLAAPKHYYETAWQHAIVVLMGVGVSLPVSLVALWWAWRNPSEIAWSAAVLFAVINGANLLPLPGLDGGAICAQLSHRIHPRFAQALMWVMMAAFVALAVALESGLIWIAVVFGLVQLTVVSSLRLNDRLPPLSAAQAWIVLLIYAALVTAYVAAGYAAFKGMTR